MSGRDAAASRELTLVELVDRLLGKGVVISGDITLAVADIDLVKVELRALVASVDSLSATAGRERLDPASTTTIGAGS